MTASDDARKTINTYRLRLQADGAQAAGDPVMLPPVEVRIIAQHLDDARAELEQFYRETLAQHMARVGWTDREIGAAMDARGANR